MNEWSAPIWKGAGKGLCKMKDMISRLEKGRQKQVGESHASLYFYRGIWIVDIFYSPFIIWYSLPRKYLQTSGSFDASQQQADLKSVLGVSWMKKLIILFWSWVGCCWMRAMQVLYSTAKPSSFSSKSSGKKKKKRVGGGFVSKFRRMGLGRLKTNDLVCLSETMPKSHPCIFVFSSWIKANCFYS